MSTLKCLIAGCAQWCPALIEIPLLSNKSATSCGCAPFTKKDTIPNLFSGFPIILKRHFGASLRDMLGAAEHILVEGIN